MGSSKRVTVAEEATYAPSAPTTVAPTTCADDDMAIEKVGLAEKTCAQALHFITESQGAEGACDEDFGFGILAELCCATCTGSAPDAAPVADNAVSNALSCSPGVLLTTLVVFGGAVAL